MKNHEIISVQEVVKPFGIINPFETIIKGIDLSRKKNTTQWTKNPETITFTNKTTYNFKAFSDSLNPVC